MTKQQAISIWGTMTAMAPVLGITRQAITAWPDVLDQWRIDLVVGAAIRDGKIEDLRRLGIMFGQSQDAPRPGK